MDSNTRDIIYAIRKIAGVTGLKPVKFMTANVDAVQEATRTITCTIILGESNLQLTEVRLQTESNDGFILFPKIDTDVLICMLSDNTAYVVLCNDIDKCICVIDANNKYEFDAKGFIFNGGTLDGMVKINPLVQKINDLENLVNNLLNTLKTTIIPLAASGTYPFAPMYASFNAIAPITQKTDLENTKIKQ